MSRERRLLLRWTSSALALLLGAGPLPHAAAPAGAALVSGVVIATDGATPLEGARVHLASAATERRFVSGPSDSRGAFHLAELEAGTYHVAVESGGGLYAVASPIVLAPGQTHSIHLQVEPAPPEQPAPQSAKKGQGVWSNPLYSSLLVVGVAVAVGVIIQQTTSDTNPPIVSPSGR